MDEDKKSCGKCAEDKPLSDYYRNAARYDGLSGYCIPCQRAADDETQRRQRRELLALLGGRCNECGFDNPLALQVDHVNGGGNIQRRGGLWASPANLLRIVRSDPDEYQLLCANCNIIKRMTLGEHVGARVYVRNPPTERKPRDPSRQKARYAATEASHAEFRALIETRRPAETSSTRLPGGSWSRHWLRCLGCQRSDRRHACEGLCTACNARLKRNYGSG